MLRRLRNLWRNTTHRPEVDRALSQELAAYIDLLAAEKRQAGMTAADAWRMACAEAGIVGTTEAVRDARSGALFADVGRELRHACRALWRTPVFSLTAILTLGIGVGATTTIFSVVNSALLHPLPFANADRLTLITEASPGKAQRTGAPYPDVLEWQRQLTAFSELAAYWNVRGDGAVFDAPGAPERVQYTITSDRLFPTLGIRPAMGRGFLAAEMTPGRGNVFVASDALWRRAMGGSANALGHAYQIDGKPYTLVGVLPPRAQFPDDCDLWLPLGSLDGFPLDRISHQFWVIGQLKPGVGLQQAQAELSAVEHRLSLAYPVTDANWQVRVSPLLDEFVGTSRIPLLVMLGAAMLILLIACASVANLTLARALARDREFAIRTALGASRGRLIRHCLAESTLVSSGGLLIGLAFAAATHKVLFGFTALGASRVVTAGMDDLVWGAAALLAAGTSLIVGLVPAIHAIRRAPQDALRGRPGTDTAAGAGRRTQRALVVAEVALTVLLLAGTALIVRSVTRLTQVDPGFRADHLLTLQLALPDASYPTRRSRVTLYHGAVDRISQLPGVRAVATSDELPLSGAGSSGFGENFGESFNIVGRPVLDWARAPAVVTHPVSAGYFGTLEIPILRGRAFASGDTDVMVINQAMAERYWPGSDPIDQQVETLDEPARPIRIIGVAGNVRSAGLDHDDVPQMYFLGDAWSHASMAIRTDGDPLAIAGAVRRAVAALDPHVPVYQMAAMDDLLSRSFSNRRVWLILLSAFGSFALAIAAVGIAGLLAFTVRQRTHEIGVRAALGANASAIARSVGGPIMSLVGVGIVVGLVAAVALTRLMTTMLFGVAPGDPVSLLAAATVVAIVAVAAASVPIWRAVRIDPLLAIRRS